MSDLSGATWRKSLRSGSEGNCVEVAGNLTGIVGVRDSKDAHGAALVFDAAAWSAFVAAVKTGTFDR